jgi:NADPH2:quinone reductase
MSVTGSGAYAEYIATLSSHAYSVPAALRPGVAATALLQGLAALTLVREAYIVQKGDLVLVHAPAGGVGLWLCQFLRAVGVRTIGTPRTEEKMDLARKNGADVMINYKKENGLVGRVKELTSGTL